MSTSESRTEITSPTCQSGTKGYAGSPPPSPRPGRSSRQVTAALSIVHQQPCLVCGKYGVDAAHWPARRSHGAWWGLLEVIPLCRTHHTLLDNYVNPWPSIIAELGGEYHRRMLALHGDGKVYCGDDTRIREVSLD